MYKSIIFLNLLTIILPGSIAYYHMGELPILTDIKWSDRISLRYHFIENPRNTRFDHGTCAEELSIEMDPVNQICCDYKINWRLAKNNTICCGLRSYDPELSICCGGKVHHKMVGMNKCCGFERMQDDKVCCLSTVYNKPKNVDWGCCANLIFDKRTHRCCNYTRIAPLNSTCWRYSRSRISHIFSRFPNNYDICTNTIRI